MRMPNGWMVVLTLVCGALASWPTRGQVEPEAPGVSQQPAEPAAETDAGMVRLNFPETVDLKVLVDYVGQRQGINFIYDKSLQGKQVTIKAPEAIPADSIMALLTSALRMNGLVLSETGVPGMMRVEAATDLAKVSVGPGAVEGEPGAAQPVTRVFTLGHAGADQLAPVVTPFLSSPQASLTPLPDHGLVIVTDYAGNMQRVTRLIELLDRPRPESVYRFVPVTHLDAAELAAKVTSLLSGGDGGGAGRGGAAVRVVADERTNQVVVVGRPEGVETALGLIASLDVGLGLETRVYSFEIASAARVDELVQKLIGPLAAERLYQSATDEQGNLLIASATPDIHEQIEMLRERLDRPRPESQSPIRFYKLENAKAAEVLTTLQEIEGETGLLGVSFEGLTPTEAAAQAAAAAEAARYERLSGPDPETVNRSAAERVGAAAAGREARRSAELPGARVMADEPTNTLIIVAPPRVQALYAELIERLDVRRPQVLVEATVVLLDTTDSFSLGVEISRTDDLDGEDRVLNFSSFGLSEVDPDTGRLTLTPGVGFNGAVLSADIADIIIRALESDARAKVTSRPSVLVNDNAQGVLVSENEEPFASVNASNTVATTSFAGFAAAGTTIRVTPQISEGDHLMLEYSIELSSFSETASDTDAAAGSLPPARQTNALESVATIPDGYTIVVGGLTRENVRESIDRVPVLGSIPGLELLFSNRNSNARTTTLFVFIRAVILRDDKFEDLKYLSQAATAEADLPGDAPASEPAVMR